MAGGEELLILIDNEIPEGRKCLQENYMNLENVAKYCEENYQKVDLDLCSIRSCSFFMT